MPTDGPNLAILSSRWRKAWVAIATLSCLVVVIAASVLPKHIGYDSQLGLLTAMHFDLNRSSAIDYYATASSDDLQQATVRRLTWWPPGYQAIPYAVHRCGVPWGIAVRICIVGGLVVGFWGWTIYFRHVTHSTVLTAFCVLLLVCSPFLQEWLFAYEAGDLYEWAAVPWLVLLAYQAIVAERPLVRWTCTASAGFIAVAVFLLKYSGALYGVAVVFWLSTQLLIHSTLRQQLIALVLGLAVAGALLFMLDIRGVGSPAEGGSERWAKDGVAQALIFVTLPPVAGTDAVRPLERMFVATSLPSSTAIVIGSIFGSLCWVLLIRVWGVPMLSDRNSNGVSLWGLGGVVALVEASQVAYLIASGGTVACDPRLTRSAGLLLLPFLVMIAGRGVRVSWLISTAAAALVVIIAVLPGCFGLLRSAFYLHAELSSESPRSQSGLYNSEPGRRCNSELFVREVEALAPQKGTLLVPLSPRMMFPFPDRHAMIIQSLEIRPPEYFTAGQFKPGELERVALLLDRAYIGTPAAEALQRSFAGVLEWETHELQSAPFWVLMVGRVDRHDKHDAVRNHQ